LKRSEFITRCGSGVGWDVPKTVFPSNYGKTPYYTEGKKGERGEERCGAALDGDHRKGLVGRKCESERQREKAVHSEAAQWPEGFCKTVGGRGQKRGHQERK